MKPEPQVPKPDKREERVAAALRENLRKRKQQQQARAEHDSSPVSSKD